MKKQTAYDFLTSESKSLAGLLQKLSNLERLNHSLSEALASENHIMNHCHIVNISGNALIMIADNPHWTTRLRLHIPELLIKIREKPGLEHIKAICCKTHPNYTHPNAYKKPAKERLKISSDSAQKILEVSEKLEDGKLKKILERIARRI